MSEGETFETGSQCQDPYLRDAEPADRGLKGDKGDKGDPGLSAYEIWLADGNTGTAQQFLEAIEVDPLFLGQSIGDSDDYNMVSDIIISEGQGTLTVNKRVLRTIAGVLQGDDEVEALVANIRPDDSGDNFVLSSASYSDGVLTINKRVHKTVDGTLEAEAEAEETSIDLSALGSAAPFLTSAPSGTELAVSAGSYQVGVMGAFTDVAAVAATTGEYAYFVVEQDTVPAVTTVSVVVSTTELDEFEVVGSSPVTGYITRALLGEVVSSELKIRRTGNFCLEEKNIDGDLVLWPETIGGA